MNTLTVEQQAAWDVLNNRPIQFSTEQMSRALYDYLCNHQLGDHAYGEDVNGNSVEITWSAAHQEWQVINRYDGQTDIYYDGFHEGSWEDEDPVLLRDMCDRLGLIDELTENFLEELEAAE